MLLSDRSQQHFLVALDRFHRDVIRIVDMSQGSIDRLLHDLPGHDGLLNPGSRAGDFGPLTADEVVKVQTVVEGLSREELG